MKTEAKKRVLIYGCGDMGIQTYNILKHDNSIQIIGFLDDDSNKKEKIFIDDYPVLGTFEEIKRIKSKYNISHGIVTVGDNKIRSKKTSQMKNEGLTIITAIHPNAFIDNVEKIGEGTIVEMGAFIHPETIIGKGCFVCCGAVVAHNSKVGNYVLLAGGVIFGSRVKIGNYSLIGVGASISPYITIGENVLVGTGASVIKDLPNNVIAAGVPAKILRENLPLL